MSIFNKFKALLGLGGAQITDAQGAALTAEKEAEIANSVELHALLEGELQAVIKTQAANIASYNSAIESLNAAQADLSAKVATILADIEALGSIAEAQANAVSTKADATNVANVESKIKTLAQRLNTISGAPLVKNTEEDGDIELTGKQDEVKKIPTMDEFIAKFTKK